VKHRLTAVAALAGAVAVLASGCGISGLYGVPLPGGPDTGERPYHVVAYFRDVLDLVPQSNVKVNDVGVGKITKIEAVEIDNAYAAKVTMTVNRDVTLPQNAEAAVRQTSLLGEKFVELRQPTGVAPQGTLDDGEEIPIERTQRNAEVEEVLGALSMLINGGGVEQIQTITQEMNKALEGNEADIRSLFADLDKLFAGLDAQRDQITRALEGLNKLSITLESQRDQLTKTLDGLEPGLAVLRDERAQLVTMLQALQRLGGVATDVINRSREDMIADLKALQPVLTGLADAGANLPKALELLLTFPFPDNAVDVIKGDYANLDLKIDLDLREVLDNLGSSNQPVIPVPALPGPAGNPNQIPLLPGLPGLLPALPGASGSSGSGPSPAPAPGSGQGNIFDDLLGLFGGGGGPR
jgi:phospholipid/cholesterol/gamma-HCH transport system substrate-binding protein